MTVQTYGSLSDPVVQAELAKAQSRPDNWTVYLVAANGNKRTIAQNKMFRALIQRLAQQQGRSVKYWYDYLVERFLGHIEVETEDGDIRYVLQPTSDLSVEEFSGFLNACLVFSADVQVH